MLSSAQKLLWAAFAGVLVVSCSADDPAVAPVDVDSEVAAESDATATDTVAPDTPPVDVPPTADADGSDNDTADEDVAPAPTELCGECLADEDCEGGLICAPAGDVEPAEDAVSVCRRESAIDLCDGLDTDCDGVVDEEGNQTCDDGSPCTVEECTDGACTFLPTPAACLIGGNCFISGQGMPGDPCFACDPPTSTTGWSPTAAACNDGDPCTEADACTDGSCAGSAKACDDDRTCTLDACEAGSCVHTSLLEGWCLIDEECAPSGAANASDPCLVCTPGASTDAWTITAVAETACDDTDGCTESDICQADGTCVGVPTDCDDGLTCTTDACVDGGCVADLLPVSCLIEGACQTIGTFNPDESCLWCDPTQSSEAWSPRSGPCADSSLCTIDEICIAGDCFAQNLICACEMDADCSDGDACNGIELCDKPTGSPLTWTCLPGTPVDCTAIDAPMCHVTTCDPETGGCEPVAALDGTSCDDATICTQADSCAEGVCGGSTLSCDDGNPCTSDSCDPISGCVQNPNSAPCDDDNECTDPDACLDGSCQGLAVCGCVSASDCPAINACDGQYACSDEQSPGFPQCVLL
ncbi:MAG: hypothetical protein ACI9WU_000977, partial [Myxococcota bacterium]